jgi:hypothetical protein
MHCANRLVSYKEVAMGTMGNISIDIEAAKALVPKREQGMRHVSHGRANRPSLALRLGVG